MNECNFVNKSDFIKVNQGVTVKKYCHAEHHCDLKNKYLTVTDMNKLDSVSLYMPTCLSLFIDVNECESVALNTCEQVCSNTIGGFACSCNSGYVINGTDPTKCVRKFFSTSTGF